MPPRSGKYWWEGEDGIRMDRERRNMEKRITVNDWLRADNELLSRKQGTRPWPFEGAFRAQLVHEPH